MGEFDIVRLCVDLPEFGLRRGAVGTIADEHQGRGFEVEFFETGGRDRIVVSVLADQIELLARQPAPDRLTGPRTVSDR